MTATRSNLLKLLAPLATFACGLTLLLASGDSSDARLSGSAAQYASLGNASLQKARATGDPTYYSRAERSFGAALRRDGRNLDALLGTATLAGLRHDFHGQLRRGLKAHRLMPELVSPYPEIADAQIELGRYRAAERTLQRMLDLKPNLTSYARASYYRELSGDLPGAVTAMRLAASAGGAPENVAYVQTLLGDLELQRGRIRAARVAYTGALRSMPGFPGGLAGLARTDLAGDDSRRAAARLRRAAERLPLTTTLTLLADVEAELGRTRAAGAALATARVQRGLLRGAGTRPDAEAVLFEADHGSPSLAVRLGRRVWRAAPSIRSADALGWALTRAGRPRAALPYARRALKLGSRDALFRLHAGVAAREAGLPAHAARHLRVAAKGRAALGPSAVRMLDEALR